MTTTPRARVRMEKRVSTLMKILKSKVVQEIATVLVVLLTDGFARKRKPKR